MTALNPAPVTRGCVAARLAVGGSRGRVRLGAWGLASVLVGSVVLSGCAEHDDTPDRPAIASPSATPTPTPSDGTGPSASADSLEHREIGIFQATGLKPVEDGSVVTLKGARGTRAWLKGLGATSDVVDEVSEAVETAALADDETLHGLVLHTGCMAPQTWTLREKKGELTVRVVPQAREATIDCIAAVTTLAVVTVPSD